MARRDAQSAAARQGVPVETVKTRVKRAIQRLRERMGDELGDDDGAWALLVFGARESVGTVSDPFPTLSPSTAGALGGGIAMAAGTKIAVAAVVLVAAGAAWWFVPRDGGPALPGAEPAMAAAPSPPPRTAAKERHELAVEWTANSRDVVDGKTEATGSYGVHGSVIDDDIGAPVAGATVSLVWEHARQPGKEPSAVTADDGTFRIPGAEDGDFGDLLLQADGYAETIVGAPWRDAGTTLAKFDAGDVRILRGKRVEGRVVGIDGRTPVRGARISFCDDVGSSGTMRFSHGKEMGKSGPDGAFVIEHVPPSPASPYAVFAVAPEGVGWAVLPARAGRVDARDVELRLRLTGSVTVTVQDELGAPQANARVFASPRFEPLGPPAYPDRENHSVWLPDGSGFDAVFGAKTDAAGVARFATLPVGDERPGYDFIVHGRGVAWQDHVVVAAGEEKAITIVVVAPKLVPLVAGVRVVDGDGKPVEGASVAVVHGPVDLKAMTDAAGVAIVQRKQGEATAGALGWIAVTKDGFARQTLDIKLLPDDGSPLPTVTLLRPAPIEGRVVDQDGKPVVGIHLDLVDGGSGPGAQQTGADGRFLFPDAVAGEWTLRIEKPKPWDQWAAGEQMTAIRGGDRGVVVVVRRLPVGQATLVASIVDADTGAPLSADEVWLTSAVQGDEPIRVADPATDFGAGAVTFLRVRPGRWRLWVRVAGRVAAAAEFEVAEAQTVVAVCVEVGKAGVLRGRLEPGDSGAALPAMVSAWIEDGASPEWAKPQADGLVGAARVQPDGTFSFPNVVPGRYRVWTHAPGFVVEGRADVPAGGDGVAVVTFTKTGTLTFRMAGASPSSAVQYEVSQGGEPWRIVMRIGEMKGKTYDYDASLLPGRYRWRVTFPTHSFAGSPLATEPVEGEVTVVAGETAVVDVPVVAKR